MESRSTQHAVLVAEPETAEVEGPSRNLKVTQLHESADPTHKEQTQPIESLQPEAGTAAPITQPAEDVNTPEPIY